VDASDIATLPVRLGAAVRHQRLFHPVGILAEGILTRTAGPGAGLPIDSCDVIARLSKAIGLPGGTPDIAGLAWRIPPPPDLRSCGPWDVLLASTLAGNRFALAPATSWTGVTFSSLMPLRYRNQLWWLRARLTTHLDTSDLSLDAVEHQIDSDAIEFEIEQACGMGEFAPLAHLALRRLDPSCDDIAFDPALHSHVGVELAPRWLGHFRRAAYRRSRQGRDAG
jgi:hypothetical protein